MRAPGRRRGAPAALAASPRLRLPPPLAHPLAQIRDALAVLDFATAFESRKRIDAAITSIRDRIAPSETVDLALRHLSERIDDLVGAVRSHARAGGAPLSVVHALREEVESALDMVEGLARRALPTAHVGIHAGPVVFQEGDYFGRTVNLAARIAEYARPGEVLVSQEVVDAADTAPVTFTEIGPVELKGVPGRLRLHIARRSA